jgi:hypothetical protein
MTGGGGEQNSVSEYKPPDYTIEPWKQYVNNAVGMSEAGIPRYEGQTVAPMTQQHMTASGMLQNLAQNGTASGNAANSMLYNTLQGGFDNPYATTSNPYGTESAYLDQVIGRANQKTLGDYQTNLTQNDRSHALSRTMGSDKQMLQQQKMTEALGEGMQGNALNALNQNYYGNQGIAENQINRATSAVDAERNRQMQAAGMGGQQQNMDLQAIQALMGGGDMQRGYQQELLDAQMGDFDRWWQSQFVGQDVLGNALTRAGGGAGTTTQQLMGGMSPLQTGAGLGLLGASLYNSF